ncbi:hypothetical protein RZS28_07825 [Methylocapsa polymorpha]|uniref:Uncharacterized protein n=1 Tax=Methylocapsa polymorpha TaxID=3080828 RepID=A0ABZ0HX90_9HYPH|nr:hypothetical protein RZS28_07825 [Methylocapsa sp. RX1]
MSGDENLDFTRGERLRLIIIVTNLIRRLHAAKLAFLLDSKSALYGPREPVAQSVGGADRGFYTPIALSRPI